MPVKPYFKEVNGHIEVYDANGRFMFSSDNKAEARKELEDQMTVSKC